MKNRNSIYKNLQGVSMGIMAACLALIACDKDKEFTPAMPEAKLINSITFDVSPTLPLAIGMDSMIVVRWKLRKNWKTGLFFGDRRMRL